MNLQHGKYYWIRYRVPGNAPPHDEWVDTIGEFDAKWYQNNSCFWIIGSDEPLELNDKDFEVEVKGECNGS